jgi:hypothetical protein
MATWHPPASSGGTNKEPNEQSKKSGDGGQNKMIFIYDIFMGPLLHFGKVGKIIHVG